MAQKTPRYRTRKKKSGRGFLEDKGEEREVGHFLEKEDADSRLESYEIFSWDYRHDVMPDF